MPLYKHSVRLDAPLKGLSIVPDQPPEPPAPTYSEEQLQQAVQEARAQAQAEAQQQFAPQIQQMHQHASAIQNGVLQGMEQKFDDVVRQVYERMPDMVLTLVRRVLLDVKMTPEAVQSIVLDTLSEISSESEQMEIRLSVEDLQLLKRSDANFETRFPRLTFKEDPSLKPGDCMLHSRFGLVDARVDTKLEKIADDLKGKE